MTKNTATDNTFNLSEWLSGADQYKLHRETILLLNPDDVADLAKVEEQIENLEALRKEGEGDDMETVASESLEGELAGLYEQVEEITANAKTATFRTRVLNDAELKDINKAWKQDTGKDEVDTEDLTWWARVFQLTATLEGQSLAASQWLKLADTLGGQFVKCLSTYGEARAAEATLEVSPRFRRR